ncbi:MAG TPA: hypothetical protein VEG44_08795 [Candidatus Acidoferrales bacterium]|nr:hypothetical protein [Candidatus Acidoferrales bacterium]
MCYFATVYGAVIVLMMTIPIIGCSQVLAPIITTFFPTLTPTLTAIITTLFPALTPALTPISK